MTFDQAYALYCKAMRQFGPHRVGFLQADPITNPEGYFTLLDGLHYLGRTQEEESELAEWDKWDMEQES